MKRFFTVLLVLAILAAVGAVIWHLNQPPPSTGELLLYGNVDLREVDLAFNGNQRIDQVLVQEGDHVKRGQVLARLQTNRIQPMIDQAVAEVAAQRQVVTRLKNGSRKEEIAQARATVEANKVDAANAKQTNERLENLGRISSGSAVSRQDLDNARAAWDGAQARLAVSQAALDLVLAGPRVEDIAQAQAVLAGDEAQVALLRQQLADATLFAPVDATVRSRLMEPGEMATPEKPVFSLAVLDPKWVRAYVSEPDLGKVHPGMAATVTTDSFPIRNFEGWIGFISPSAEFTPKTVETPELRSSLVYEVRVFVKDAADDLRLGMPATVHLSTERHGPESPITAPGSAPAPAPEIAPESQP